MYHKNAMCPVVGLSCASCSSLKHSKMKKIAFFVLALIAIVFADDDKDLKEVAEKFDTDVPSVQACLGEIELSIADVNSLLQKWGEVEDDEMNEETKQTLTKFNHFLGCILEKNGMIVDTKLKVDKLIESFEKDKDAKLPNKEALKKCLDSINEDEMTREDRVFGLMLCAMNNEMDGTRK